MRMRVWVGLALVALLLVGGRSAAAQTAPGAAGSGHWEGALSVQGKDLAIAVDLAAKGTTWEGTAGFPEMNAKGLPLSSITVQGEAVGFVIKGVPGDPTFKGTLSKDARTLAGDFTQGPVSGTFTLAWKGEAKIEPPPANPPVTPAFEGAWEGTLDVNGMTLRLNVTLTNQDGKVTGTMVSVDQGGAQIQLGAITQTANHLKFTVPGVGGTYEGDLKDAQITGTWMQGPGTLPLVLKRPAK